MAAIVVVLAAASAAGTAGPTESATETPPPPPPIPPSTPPATEEQAARYPIPDLPAYEGTVSGAPAPELGDGRATSEVTRAELDRRQPRSAPDALRYEPGVFVQQTAHGQGSAFIRGLTGQQTLMLFDGVRLNNSTYRQGPNQYFFTLDSHTLDSIEVLRGGASTRWGSDALGGVLLAKPLEPRLEPPPGRGLRLPGDVALVPRLHLRGATSDEERGGRFQLEASGGGTGVLAGAGYREAGLLESAGQVTGPAGEPALVPRLASDGRTQLGTGFRELTFDARAVHEPASGHRLTAAVYGYRQYDSPRTDQCPPPYAPFEECLTYEEQFRTLAYAAWDARLPPVADSLRVTASYQLQHERRRLDRPIAFVESLGRDDVHTVGATAHASTAEVRPAGWLALRLSLGGDLYRDAVESRAFQTFTDVGEVLERSRGQYLDGATYLTGGGWLDLEASVLERVTVRSGGRLSRIEARAPGDPDSGSAAVDQAFTPVVGHAGVEWQIVRPVSLLVAVDDSFRAPNLDDLTSRQQTGPGFQFENPELGPERALTAEVGARLDTFEVGLEAWAFRTWLRDAIVRRPREAADCPPDTPACGASWNRFQLVNAQGDSELRGLEAALRLRLPQRVLATATVAWAWGEGPNPGERPSDPSLPFEERVPLSRIPPLNGSAELEHRTRFGASAGAALRWARLQDRLAIGDLSDARIPRGGTPGYAVVDLRAGWRLGEAFSARLAVENVFDEPWRTHGSSVNGPGRGLVLSLEAAPF